MPVSRLPHNLALLWRRQPAGVHQGGHLGGRGRGHEEGLPAPLHGGPLTRENSGNNTGKGVPNIEYEYHPGQKYVDFIISFKGCGAELGNAMQIMTTAKLGKTSPA